jgi:hypothetical protein
MVHDGVVNRSPDRVIESFVRDVGVALGETVNQFHYGCRVWNRLLGCNECLREMKSKIWENGWQFVSL